MHLRIMDAARRTEPWFINLGCQQFHDLLAYVKQSFLKRLLHPRAYIFFMFHYS